MRLAIYVNAIFAAIICVRLIAYRHNGRPHSRVAAWISYLMIVATGSIVIRTFTGDYYTIDPAELVLNGVLCLAVVVSRGNVYLGFNRRVRYQEWSLWS